MKPVVEHAWDLDLKAARALQEDLRQRVMIEDRLGTVRRIAGVDVSFDRGSPRMFAAVVVLDATSFEVIEVALGEAIAPIPYIPGYLSFREIPALVQAFDRLSQPPDLLVCDGQGIAHPRRMGIAAHLGVIYDLPSIGCGKSLLVGSHDEPGPSRGDWSALHHQGEKVGEVLRTREKVQPVFVSPGHKLGFEAARKWILRLTPRYRLPETTRRAHNLVNEHRRCAMAGEHA